MQVLTKAAAKRCEIIAFVFICAEFRGSSYHDAVRFGTDHPTIREAPIVTEGRANTAAIKIVPMRIVPNMKPEINTLLI